MVSRNTHSVGAQAVPEQSEGIGIRTEGRWIGPPQRPLLSWLSMPEDSPGDSGVLLLPPVGYPYWSSHRTLRVIAERFAADGHLAMRIDYESSGDSSGGLWDADRFVAWKASVSVAAAELRRLGCRRLVVVGVRLGGTLALLQGEELEADAVIAWSPVVSGRRYVREIRLLSTEVPGEMLPAESSGAIVSAGTVFTEQTLKAISQCDLVGLQTVPAARVLLIDGSPQEGLAEHLRELDVEVDQLQISGGESALEQPAEYATVPEQIVEAINSWVAPAPAAARSPVAAGPAVARFDWDGTVIAEQVLELGPDRLVALLSQPSSPISGARTIVFLNSGSESHIGPARAWVEYARELACMGYNCVRVDFHGWGESPDDGHAPGRPYDQHCEQDTVAIIGALRALGHESIVIVGLCASAWIALRAVLREPVAGVLALNPQLYWRPGDPVEATMQETRLRRTAERRREELGGRYRLWTALDLLGHRPWAARWLDDLRKAQTPVALVFAEGDDGIEYLHNRLRRRMGVARRSRAVRIIEVPDIDHSMHRVWLRPRLLRILDEQIGMFEG
jgi:pimeloyl-ACP methyl ester carboxylesterase